MRARVHAVDSSNRHIYSDQIEQHFRIRHDIYVAERGWENLRRDDLREVDQFDTEDTVYLLAIDRDVVVGGSRLNPTIRPHLISDIFPHLASEGIRRGADIFEWTRVFVVKEFREEHAYSRVGSEIMCAIIEYCMIKEIKMITALVDAWWVPRFLDCGWNPEPLGLPSMVDGSPVVVLALYPTEHALKTTRFVRKIDHKCLLRKKTEKELDHYYNIDNIKNMRGLFL